MKKKEQQESQEVETVKRPSFKTLVKLAAFIAFAIWLALPPSDCRCLDYIIDYGAAIPEGNPTLSSCYRKYIRQTGQRLKPEQVPGYKVENYYKNNCKDIDEQTYLERKQRYYKKRYFE